MRLLKVVTVVGTRPEIIRLSRVLPLLDQYTNHTLIHTGQNYDHELSDIFFEDLELRKPDIYLDINTETLGKSLAGIIVGVEDSLLSIRPDAFLVLGDTNSSISLLVAKRMKVPTYHMEAGNRSFDTNVPEEVNRKAVDHLADINLVYTEHARRNLRSEGLQDRFIYKTGSPMKEVLDYYKNKIQQSDVLERTGLRKGDYIIVSIHREENVDDAKSLRKVIASLNAIHSEYSKPVIVSTHPRTFDRLNRVDGVVLNDSIRTLKPFSFTDYNKLQLDSFCAVSDSGTISEEAAVLGFPAVTLRRSIERPEALDAGSIIITGMEPHRVLSCIGLAVSNRVGDTDFKTTIPDDYLISNTSERVLKLILGTSSLVNEWRNLRDFNRYDSESERIQN